MEHLATYYRVQKKHIYVKNAGWTFLDGWMDETKEEAEKRAEQASKAMLIMTRIVKVDETVV